MTLRMNRTENGYMQAKADGELVPLASEPKLEGAPDFKYWKVIDNRFPHDRHHYEHALVVLKRDCLVDDITPSELEELWYKIFPWADVKYDYVKMNLATLRSIQNTPHLHLLVLKEDYK